MAQMVGASPPGHSRVERHSFEPCHTPTTFIRATNFVLQEFALLVCLSVSSSNSSICSPWRRLEYAEYKLAFFKEKINEHPLLVDGLFYRISLTVQC